MLKIAWRNILRNKRRTLLSLIIIIISVVVLFLVKGYISATYEGLEMMSISQTGHLQIARSGFWEQTEQRLLISSTDKEKIAEILSGQQGVREYTSELQLTGIIGTEKGSTIVSGTGIEPGSSFSQMSITEGSNLFAGDQNRVILGQGIIKQLKLKIDEWVSIMATTIDGAYNANSLQVTGAFSTGYAEADNHYVMMPIEFAQSLLNVEGVDKLIILLDESENTEKVINELRQDFNESGMDLEIKSWFDLANYYHQVKGLYDMIFFFISVVIFILVFFQYSGDNVDGFL